MGYDTEEDYHEALRQIRRQRQASALARARALGLDVEWRDGEDPTEEEIDATDL